MNTLVQDLPFALRMLVKSPGFTAVTVLTLAFGIAATTVMFSIVDGLLLAPLPYFQPDRLIAIMQSNQRLGYRTWISYPNFRDWQHDAQSFERMAALTWQGFDLTSPGPPQHIEGKPVSAGLFGTLGVKLALGREFTPQEDAHAGAPVVIISQHLWETRFAKTPEILNRSLTLDGTSYAVVGVLPPNFHFFGDAEVYTPLGQDDPILLNNRAIHPGILAIARLKTSVDIARAQAEITTIQNRLDMIYPEANRYEGADVVSLKQQMVGNAGSTPLMLFGAVTVLLLIACANVASLLLSRAAARKQEFAVRSALGASRAQLLRQLLVESMLLSLAGGVAGCVLAAWGVHPLLTLVAPNLPRSEEIGVNGSVLIFTAAVSLLVGMVFGLVPALRSSKPDLEFSLKSGGRGLTSWHHRTQDSLVVAQVALTMVLLVSAALLLRTVRSLWSVNPGFEASGLITFKVGLPASGTRTVASIRIAYRQLIECISNIPGVEAVDFTNLVPLTLSDNDSPFWIGTQRPESLQGAPRLNLFFTGPNYLQTMKIPLLRGRFLTQQDDNTSSTPALVIDTEFASTYLPGKDPIGQVITIAHWGPCRIVGVAGHVKHWGLGDTSQLPKSVPVYASFYEVPDRWVPVVARDITIVVRTPVDAAVLIALVKKEAQGAGSDDPIYDVHSMREIVARSMSSQRYPMTLLGAFASLALILASVGIYGVISYSISQRTQEMGIRMALGAYKRDVLWMVIGHGLRLVLIGLAVGIGSAFAITRALSGFSHLLYGVKQDDPLSFMVVSLGLTVVAAVASYIPARRATKVDPMVALRYE
jgi:predicted permease